MAGVARTRLLFIILTVLITSTADAQPPPPPNPPPVPPEPPAICGPSEHPYLDVDGNDYRDGRLAKYMQERKRFMREARRLKHDPDLFLEWLQQQDLYIEGDSNPPPGPPPPGDPDGPGDPPPLEPYLFLDPCKEWTLEDWIGWLFGPDQIKVPVLLGEYPDEPMTNSASAINSELYGTSNPWSVTKYFMEVSDGQLELTGDVFGPYVGDEDYADYDYSSAADAKSYITNLIAKADPYVDFSLYDADGDNYVDALTVVASGYMGPGGAHKGNLGPYVTDDGVSISTYTFQGEYYGVGVYCHEFCHVLGLPDLYGGNAAGDWDIMSGLISDPPEHLSAWGKIELGWLEPTRITDPVNDLAVRAVEDYAEVYQLSMGALPLEEYFLVENRQQTGFDTQLPASGMLIWHVGDDLALEQADGLYEIEAHTDFGDSGDPFPGSTGATEFTGDTTPNSDLENGDPSGIEVTDITGSGGTMNADVNIPLVDQEWRGLRSGTTYDLRDICFVNEATGWVVGSQGTVLHTTDGGKDWQRLSSHTNATLYAVQFINAQTGWVAGASGTILYTEDGGSSWTTQSSGTGNTLVSLSFADENNGWAMGRSMLLHTADGGSTWNDLEVAALEDLYAEDMQFLDDQTGYIISDDGNLLKTEDGGTTWTTTSLGSYVLFGMHATDDDLWIVGEDGTILYVDAETTNVIEYADSSGINGLDVHVNSVVGAIVGSSIQMFDHDDSYCDGDCTDGTWDDLGFELAVTLRAVHFPSDDVGYACGDDGAILKYEVDYEINTNPDWALNIAGLDGEGRGVVADEEGNVYMTGFFEGSPKVDPLGSSGDKIYSLGYKDAFVLKYDPRGKLVWANTFGTALDNDYGRDITLDHSGHLYVVGSFQDSAMFSLIPLHFLVSSGGLDVFVCKMDLDGHVLWVRGLGGTDTDRGKGVAVDESGNVYVTGFFEELADMDPGAGAYWLSSAGGMDAFVCKLDPDGNLLWAEQVGGVNDDVGFGIGVDDDRVYLAGYFADLSYMGTYASGASPYLSSSGDTDIFVNKYVRDSGTLVWTRRVGGNGPDRAYDLALDKESNSYVTGYFNGTVDFDPTSVGTSYLSAGGTASETFVLKLGVDGELAWAAATRQWGSGTDANGISSGHSIALDEKGCNVYVTGRYQGNVDFDPGSGSDWMAGPTCSYSSCYDVFVWNLAGDGDYHWVVDGGGDYEDTGRGIATSAQGNIFTTGYFDEEIAYFGGIELASPSGTGFRDIFLWKK